MMTHDEFRFGRHLELWKDQNRHAKRVAILILLFGFLVLHRVLLPFQAETEEIGNRIKESKAERTTVDNRNKLLLELEDQLKAVKTTIREEPWVGEKNELVETFQRFNRTGAAADAQAAADQTVRNISRIVRSDVVAPLAGTLAADPQMAAHLPAGLTEKLDALKQFADQWENEHLGKRWYGTLAGKNQEVYELTLGLDRRVRQLSDILTRTQEALGRQLAAGKREITALDARIAAADKNLEELMDKLFPQWMKGIIRVQQMTQLFPLLLVAALLYLAWVVGSMSRHYAYVVRQLKFEEDDRGDAAAVTVWTLADKSRAGEITTIGIYCAIVALVWVAFDGGMQILKWWLPLAGEEELLLSAPLAQTGAGVVHWVGGTLFVLLMAAVIMNQRIRALLP